MFSIFSTAQKLPKIFTIFFGKCKIFHKKYEKINGKHFNLIYDGEGIGNIVSPEQENPVLGRRFDEKIGKSVPATPGTVRPPGCHRREGRIVEKTS